MASLCELEKGLTYLEILEFYYLTVVTVPYNYDNCLIL